MATVDLNADLGEGIGDDAARPADPAGADTDSEVRAGR